MLPSYPRDRIGFPRMKYCSRCVMPDTKPDLQFNSLGVCTACTAFENRAEVDWEARRVEFLSIVERYKNRGAWDCLVPVSGGKDSTYQLLKLLESGLRPLAVTSSTCDLTELGRENLKNIGLLGVDHIEVTPNRIVRAKMNKLGLELVGDISWPEHVGIFTIPIQLAVKMNVPLIIWGENSQNEYGGPAAASSSNTLNRRWLEEFGGLLGLRVSDIPSLLGVDDREMSLYRYPSDEELQEVGVTGLFLGHYFPWDGLTNALVAQAYGLKTYGAPVEGSIVDYENLDNYQTGIHDYFKYLKFGFGRASDIASLQVRRGRLSREQAIELVRRRDGAYPSSYLGQSLSQTLDQIGMSLQEFDEICDRFTTKSLFLEGADGSLVRGVDGAPLKRKYDN